MRESCSVLQSGPERRESDLVGSSSLGPGVKGLRCNQRLVLRLSLRVVAATPPPAAIMAGDKAAILA